MDEAEGKTTDESRKDKEKEVTSLKKEAEDLKKPDPAPPAPPFVIVILGPPRRI